MKIIKLKLRGAYGIKKGMGLDEIYIDLSNISGLVALAGQNGRGKTTLLENLSPYRQFASRTGAMQRHFFLKDSFRDLTFEYGGDIYRTLVKINAESDRTEGYIWKNDQPMVDGKVTNYSRYIEDLLGSSNLFYNSVFCAQNASKMSDMTTGDLKKLFVEFLRLDRLSGYEQAAKQCGNVLDSSGAQIHKNIEALQARIDQFMEIDEQIRQAEQTGLDIQGKQAATANVITEVKADIEGLTDIDAKNSVNIERRQALDRDIAALKNERKDNYNDHMDELSSLTRKIIEKKDGMVPYQDILKNREAITQAAEKGVEIESHITQAREKNNTMGADIDVLYESLTKVQTERDSLNADLKGIESNPDRTKIDIEAVKLHEAMQTLLTQNADFEKALVSIAKPFELVEIDSAIKSCREAMSLLDQRGDCPVENPQCAFVLSALKARDRLDELEKDREAILVDIDKKVAEINREIAENTALYNTYLAQHKTIAWADYELKSQNDKDIADINLKIQTLDRKMEDTRNSIFNTQGDRSKVRKTIDTLVSDLEETRVLSGQMNNLQAAESKIEQIEKEVKALEAQKQEKQDQYSKADIQSKTKLSNLESRLEEIDKMIDEDVAWKLIEAKERLKSHQEGLDGLVAKAKENDEYIAVLKQRLEEKATIEKEIASAQAELCRVTAEAAQWRYLQNACGKSGLQALEIDGVAPLITGYANNLLTSTFGPNFSVRLITQDPETGKEILDIVVIRGDGSETSLENLSGGEKVWVLKSLRLAMTLVSKQKSGRNFQTILADEEDGPLDVEKAQSFVGLYKAILDVGGFNSCFYISHNPEVVGMADHRIQFSHEGIQVA